MIHLAARTFRDLLYPERCIGCGAFGEIACSRCLARLHEQDRPSRCKNCSARWDGEDNCPRCYAWDALDGAFSAHEMEGMARKMIHGLKYNYIESLAALLAEDIALLLKQDVADSTDKKVPASAVGAGLLPAFAVPLHPSRLKQRGFNQAELILDATGWARGEGHLRRIRKTESQVGKRARDRVRNVGGAFAYNGPSLKGVTVVLIDDVITTGATANECARTLKDHGAQSVWGVAFARASHDPAKPGSPIAD